MTRLADLSLDALTALLAGRGLSLDFGDARARIRSEVAGLAPAIQRAYGEFAHDADASFHDVAVRLRWRGGAERLGGARIELESDADIPFEPFPAGIHLPLLEWGLNYLLAQRLNHRLLLHAGVVELDGHAIVMPALPGTGKSTLTAALVTRGARLLSDEFGIVGLEDGRLHPMVRPVSLKNASIDVMSAFASDATFVPRFPGTRKGTVAYLAPDARSYRERRVPAVPGLVLFPRYEEGAQIRVETLSKARAFAKLAVNSFNYEILGPDGFDAVGRLLQAGDVYRLGYGSLPDAIDAIAELVSRLERHA